MPQDEVLVMLGENRTQHLTVSEIAKLLKQSAPSVRVLIRKLWKDDQLRRTMVKRGHQNVFAYTIR